MLFDDPLVDSDIDRIHEASQMWQDAVERLQTALAACGIDRCDRLAKVAFASRGNNEVM